MSNKSPHALKLAMPTIHIRKEARPRSGPPELRRVVPDTNYMERLPTERSLPEISLPKLHDTTADATISHLASPPTAEQNASPTSSAVFEKEPSLANEPFPSPTEAEEEDTGTSLLLRQRSESYNALQQKLEATSQNQERIREELQEYLVEVRQKLQDVDNMDEDPAEDEEEDASSKQTPKVPLTTKLSQLVLTKSEDLPEEESGRLHHGMSKIERLDSILSVVESKVGRRETPPAVMATSTPRRPKISNLMKPKRRRKKKGRRVSGEVSVSKPDEAKQDASKQKEAGKDKLDLDLDLDLDLEEFAKKTLLTDEEQARLDRLLDEGEETLLITNGSDFPFGEPSFSDEMGQVDNKLRQLLGEEEWQEKLKFISGTSAKQTSRKSSKIKRRKRGSSTKKRQ